MSAGLKAIIILPDGNQEEVELTPGISLAKSTVDQGVPGIRGECGFTLACATCHVFVAEEWMDLLDEMSADEDDMLEGTTVPRRPNSRLACQIIATPSLNGIIVELPSKQ